MSKEFQKDRISNKKLGKKELVRDIYVIFEECLNYGRYGHAASLALLPELEGYIPQEKIREVKDGLSEIIKRLDNYK